MVEHEAFHGEKWWRKIEEEERDEVGEDCREETSVASLPHTHICSAKRRTSGKIFLSLKFLKLPFCP